ncbi:type II secretion system F family protein [Jannaschia sp. LMIT008]|uniref:type II secretion system F family protein n=1 Tax=Jannaschia maritima TaxID=3032585 RepID=UPI002810B76C|nr:type II secretion system F family protein [Jannaschia sp. LMIT008]
MDAVLSLIEAYLGPDGLIWVAGGAGALLVVLALPMLLRKPADPMARVRAERAKTSGGAAAGLERLSRHGATNALLEKYAAILEPEDEAALSSTRAMLLRAGYAHRDAVRTLTAAQLILGLGLLALGVLYVLVLGTELSPEMMGLYAVGPGVAGYYAPKYWLKKRVAARQEEIQDGFPDALDLLLVCVEAGQSLDQAIVRMAREIEPSYPALAQEFLLVSQEMKAGKDKGDVLRAMADRCDLQDITSFVTVLIQSQAFGTSVAEALRIYAAEMRDKRVMRAEEKANVLPTKLTVGTMMFCVPPLLIILIGPSIHGIATSLGGSGAF